MRLAWLAIAGCGALIALLLSGLGTVVGISYGKDKVPSRRVARDYIVREFPKAAPVVLLKDERGRRFRTDRLWVEAANRCARTDRQVECRFEARLVARKPGAFPAVRCGSDRRHDAEVWVKLRDGKPIGRPGDYVCKGERRARRRPQAIRSECPRGGTSARARPRSAARCRSGP
jgi:hypothetical protein